MIFSCGKDKENLANPSYGGWENRLRNEPVVVGSKKVRWTGEWLAGERRSIVT